MQDELVRLGEQMVHSAEGTRAIALELCREFEDKFLQHVTSGEVCRFFKSCIIGLMMFDVWFNKLRCCLDENVSKE